MGRILDFFKRKSISKEDIELMELFNKFYFNITDLLIDLQKGIKVSEKNNIINKIYERIGYAKVPRLFSNEENVNGIKVYRGISAQNKETLNSYIKQFLEGDLYLGGRASIYGLGIYTYYGENKELLDNYASSGGYDTEGEILEIIIPSDCKLISISKLTKLQDYFFNLYQSTFKTNKDEKYNLYIEEILSNIGCFAATLGYDAINVEDKKYIVILNRSKIIVNDKIIKDTKSNSR